LCRGSFGWLLLPLPNVSIRRIATGRPVTAQPGNTRHERLQHLPMFFEPLLPAEESVKAQLYSIGDLERLERMHRRAVKAANWQEILATP
jgi:hypothetical protein